MGTRPNRRRGNSRHNFNRRNNENGRNNRNHRTEEKPEDSGMVCTLCNRPIRELHSAIAHGTEHEPAHFDCILKGIAQNEELESSDKVCYLGNGSFGIITFRNSSSPIRFLIKKRIQYEPKDEIPVWRKNMVVKYPDFSKKEKPQ